MCLIYFLGSGTAPPVYSLDTTHPDQWDKEVFQPACQILYAWKEVRILLFGFAISYVITQN